MRRSRLGGVLCWAVVLLVVGACDSTSPVATEGSFLTISANPASIDSNGQSTITVMGFLDNGTPFRRGTRIQFSTTLGSIDEMALTDGQGIARATLLGQGQNGLATVQATSGLATSASVSVQIGTVSGSLRGRGPVAAAPEGGRAPSTDRTDRP